MSSGSVDAGSMRTPLRRNRTRCYGTAHEHVCGIDLHARSMYHCVLGAQGPVFGVECMFSWSWVADR